MEKVGAMIESPLGDDYFVKSVEEFYCDVGKDELKMSKKKKDKKKNQISRVSHARYFTFFLLYISLFLQCPSVFWRFFFP